MPNFIKGRIISYQLYSEIISPLLDDVPHDACLIGEGSDVLGYDQPISMDHDWGPRITIFLANEKDIPIIHKRIITHLPPTFKGFDSFKDEEASNIHVSTVSKWLKEHLNIETIDSMQISDWLSLPQQHIIQFIGGSAFANSLGEYEMAKKRLSWYPKDIWLWMMAAQWYKIWGTERLIYRTQEANDLLGSQLIIQKLIQQIVDMIFLQHKRFKPYDKWVGTVFKEIDVDQSFEKKIFKVISSENVKIQTELLQSLLTELGDYHNKLDITKVVKPKVQSYEVGVMDAVRPYPIFNSSEYKDACIESIKNPSLKRMVFVGSIDQFVHTSDALINFTDWKKYIKEGIDMELQMEE